MKTIVERMIKHFPSKMETDLLKGRVKDVPDMSMDKLAKNMKCYIGFARARSASAFSMARSGLIPFSTSVSMRSYCRAR